MEDSHFNQRCRERGIVESDTDLLFDKLVEAIRALRHGEENGAIELALTTDAGQFFRFRVPEGLFYAVTEPGGWLPKTVYDQQMFRRARNAHRAFRRRHRLPLAEKPVPRGRAEKRKSGRRKRHYEADVSDFD